MGPSSKTPRYCAPEVAASQPRNSASDIWSLGCVFLEIWTTLCGTSVTDLTQYLKDYGSRTTFYYANRNVAEQWCQKLVADRSAGKLKSLEWIESMLEMAPEKRCTAQILCDQIAEVDRDPEVSCSFAGRCCTEEEDSAESVESSDENEISAHSLRVESLPELDDNANRSTGLIRTDPATRAREVFSVAGTTPLNNTSSKHEGSSKPSDFRIVQPDSIKSLEQTAFSDQASSSLHRPQVWNSGNSRVTIGSPPVLSTTNQYLFQLYDSHPSQHVPPTIRAVLDLHTNPQRQLNAVTRTGHKQYLKDYHSVLFQGIPRTPLAELLVKVAKVLDELGFAYYVIDNGFTCSYPVKYALKALQEVTDPRIGSHLRNNGRIYHIVRQYLPQVLENWRTHLDYIKKYKETPFSGSHDDVGLGANITTAEWGYDHCNLEVRFIKRTRFVFVDTGNVHGIGFTVSSGNISVPDTLLPHAILSGLPPRLRAYYEG